MEEIVDLAERYGAMTMVDEAHATGVFGPNGAGVVAEMGLRERVLVQMGTLGKALGGFGAYVAGKQNLRELLINRCRSFIFTTALPPVMMAMAITAIDLLEKEPERRFTLWRNSQHLKNELKDLGFSLGKSSSQILPLMIGNAGDCMSFSECLLAKGVYAQGIRPPTVQPGSARLRITSMATHTDEHLKQAIQAFKEVKEENEPRL